MKRRVHRTVELAEDLGRRRARRQQSGPGDRLEIRKPGLDHGRQLGQERAPLRARDRERAQPAFLDERKQDRNALECELDVAGHHILDRWTAAAIGHMHHVDPRARLERFADEVRQGADPAGGEVDLAGIGLGVGDELLHRSGRH